MHTHKVKITQDIFPSQLPKTCNGVFLSCSPLLMLASFEAIQDSIWLTSCSTEIQVLKSSRKMTFWEEALCCVWRGREGRGRSRGRWLSGVNANVFPWAYSLANPADTQPFELGPASLAHLLLAEHEPSTASCCCWHVYSCLSSSDSPPLRQTQQVLPGTQCV